MAKAIRMRTRRLITFSVLATLIAAAFLGFGFPADNEETVALTSPSSAAVSKPAPVSIFDPPKYSITEADSLWVVVNKHRPIAKRKYAPTELVAPTFKKPAVQNPNNLKLRKEAADSVSAMAKAMQKAGKGRLVLNSGFRSFKTQAALYERTKATRGLAVAEKLSARPGHSEHQTGLAADFAALGQGCVIMTCFGKTEAGIWLRKNAADFGFIIRYPAGYQRITGFQYEPWHLRFVGIELATEMKARGIKTLEEFWGLDSAPDYLK